MWLRSLDSNKKRMRWTLTLSCAQAHIYQACMHDTLSTDDRLIICLGFTQIGLSIILNSLMDGGAFS